MGGEGSSTIHNLGIHWHLQRFGTTGPFADINSFARPQHVGSTGPVWTTCYLKVFLRFRFGSRWGVKIYDMDIGSGFDAHVVFFFLSHLNSV